MYAWMYVCMNGCACMHACMHKAQIGKYKFLRRKVQAAQEKELNYSIPAPEAHTGMTVVVKLSEFMFI